jgi:hypothetical protein
MLAQQHERGHPTVAFRVECAKSCCASTGWLPRMACASSSVQRSAASSTRAIRPLATRRANSGGGSARDITTTVIRSGTSSSPCAKARALAGRGVGLVEVVEDDDARRRQCGEEIAEEAANEAGKVLLRL